MNEAANETECRRPEPGKQDAPPPTVQANDALVNARDIAKTYSIGKRSLEVLRHLNLTSDQAHLCHGYKVVEHPEVLGHFFAKFAPL